MTRQDYRRLNSLVEKAMKGDEKAFSKLCKLQAQRVIYSCIRQMGNQHDGEDAAQEVFVRMHNKIGTLQSPEAFIVWTQRIIQSVCSNMRRTGMKQTEELPIEEFADLFDETDEQVLPENYLNKKENRKELMSMIDTLPDKARACIVMFYFEQLKISEIAASFNLSENTVKSQLFLGRERLKKELGAHDTQSYQKASNANALLPMGALTAAFNKDMEEVVSVHIIKSCLTTAGISVKTSSLGAIAALAMPAIKTTSTAAACIVLASSVVAGGYVSSKLSSSTPPNTPNNTQNAEANVTAAEEPIETPAEQLPEPEIEAVTSEAAPEQPADQTTAAETKPTRVTVSGSATIEGTSGTDQRYTNYYVELQNGSSRIASATLNTQGSYTFKDIYIGESGQYTLALFATNNYDTASISPQTITLEMVPGNTYTIGSTFRISGMEEPSATISLCTTSGEETLTNPQMAYIYTRNLGQAEISWTIKETTTGTVVASGQEGLIDRNIFSALGNGGYSLSAQARGAYGTAQATKAFTVNAYE